MVTESTGGAAGYWAGKTVIVTGGTGFMGSHFTERLLGLGATVLCLHRRDNRGVLPQLPATDRLRPVRVDLCDEAAVRAVFAGAPNGVDAVVDCAAITGGPDERRATRAATILDTNVRITSQLLRCAREFDVEDTVLLSSSDIYLTPTERPTREEDDFRAALPYDTDGYYLAKNYTEILAESYRIEHGMNVFLPRPTSVYGPRDNFEADSARVVPRMFAKAVAGEEIEIWGDGSQTRTYMYVTDMVDAVLRMVEAGKHQVLNIGTEETVSVRRLAELVCAALGRPERIRLDPTKPGGRASRTLDLGRLGDVMDFAPRSLEEGLRLTAEWYRRHRMPAAPVSR